MPLAVGYLTILFLTCNIPLITNTYLTTDSRYNAQETLEGNNADYGNDPWRK